MALNLFDKCALRRNLANENGAFHHYQESECLPAPASHPVVFKTQNRSGIWKVLRSVFPRFWTSTQNNKKISKISKPKIEISKFLGILELAKGKSKCITYGFNADSSLHPGQNALGRVLWEFFVSADGGGDTTGGDHWWWNHDEFFIWKKFEWSVKKDDRISGLFCSRGFIFVYLPFSAHLGKRFLCNF